MTNSENIRMRIFDHSLAEERSCKDIISALAPEALLNETRPMRVAVYIRTAVPCDGQVSTCELLIETHKKQIAEHSNWAFAGIYQDECSGTKDPMRRKAMHEMFEDCKAGKIDLIITRSISRIARNINDFISVVNTLKSLDPPVGIWCEIEDIYTLDLDSDLVLEVLSDFAEEESRMKAQHGGGGHRW